MPLKVASNKPRDRRHHPRSSYHHGSLGRLDAVNRHPTLPYVPVADLVSTVNTETLEVVDMIVNMANWFG